MILQKYFHSIVSFRNWTLKMTTPRCLPSVSGVVRLEYNGYRGGYKNVKIDVMKLLEWKREHCIEHTSRDYYLAHWIQQPIPKLQILHFYQSDYIF